jgi:hypothetical protein
VSLISGAGQGGVITEPFSDLLLVNAKKTAAMVRMTRITIPTRVSLRCMLSPKNDLHNYMRCALFSGTLRRAWKVINIAVFR